MAPKKSEASNSNSSSTKSAGKKLKPIITQNQFGLKAFLQPSPPKPPVASSSKVKAGSSKADVIQIDSGSDDAAADEEVVKEEERPAKRLKSTSSPKGKGKGKADVVTEKLWVDEFAPRDLDELGIHKKKAADVQNWLSEALENPKLAKYRRILVLTGPAGSAKTATVRVLSKEMDFDILEYKSGLEGGADSLVNQFPAFLNRAASVPMLSFGSTSASPDKKGKKKASTKATNKKVILVEDLPNIFTSFPTKQAFRSALIAFANSTRGYTLGIPLIVIISEALVKTSNDSEWAVAEGGPSWQDNVSARNILPVEVLKGGKCTEIKFNSIAISFMRKALNTTLDRVYTTSDNMSSLKQPSPEALEVVARAANGDIRAALNSLQFLVKEGKYTDGMTTIMGKVTVKKGKKRKAGGKVKDIDSTELDHLGAPRESSLFIFHALGKVLFSKRWGEKPEDDAKDLRPKAPKTDKLPDHLSQYHRRPSKVDPNALFADAPVDADMFMSYLHQNYTSYCDTIDQCSNAMDYFSSADAMLRMENERFSKHPLTSHYSFQTSVRGMLMSLPAPVPRRGQRMFKAEAWDRNRRQRENEQNIADLVSDVGSSLLQPLLQLDREEDDDGDGMSITLPTRAALIYDLVPYLPLLGRKVLSSLPNHSAAIVKELAVFPPPQKARGNIMDEDYVGEDEDEADEAPVSLGELAEQEGQDVVVEELLYLPDDDIESFDDE